MLETAPCQTAKCVQHTRSQGTFITNNTHKRHIHYPQNPHIYWAAESFCCSTFITQSTTGSPGTLITNNAQTEHVQQNALAAFRIFSSHQPACRGSTCTRKITPSRYMAGLCHHKKHCTVKRSQPGEASRVLCVEAVATLDMDHKLLKLHKNRKPMSALTTDFRSTCVRFFLHHFRESSVNRIVSFFSLPSTTMFSVWSNHVFSMVYDWIEHDCTVHPELQLASASR